MNRPVAPGADAPARLDPAQIRTIMAGVVLAMLLGALDQTIVATALPTIGRELGDVENLSWVVTAYLLTSTAVTPLYGKLSDVHGRRLMLLIAIGLFLAGSIACGLSRNIYALIGARAFQGLGGGGLMSLGLTIVGDVIAPRERGRYQAYFAAIFVTSSIAGPVLGGFFAEYLHWSFIFWINLPLGLAAYLMTNQVLKLLPRHDRPHRIDGLGAALMVAATVALLLALTWGGTAYPWDSLPILALLAGSVVLWGLFATRLVLAPEPFIPLDVLANGVVRNGVGATFFAVGAMIGLSVYVPLYFEVVLGLTAAQSGFALVAFMGGTVTGAMGSGRIMMHVEHYKRTAVIGLAFSTVATAVLAFTAMSLSFVAVEAFLVVIGLGIGTMFPISTTAIQNAVPPQQMGTATGILNFARSLGGAILVVAFGAIFLADATGGGEVASVQTVILEGLRDGVDFGTVFRDVFLAAAIALGIAWVFTLLMEERPLRSAHHAPPAEVG
ncbi:MAG TPA: MDR family MFS transporter [Bauldia sp.]|nr:MDR family MFS transporter [Bauldia sp.]